MQEFDIDFGENKPYLCKLEEWKPKTVGGIDYRCFYYPGFELRIKSIRDPFPKMVRIFVPSLILGMFLI